MTRAEHITESQKHREAAIALIKKFRTDTRDTETWEQYKKETKLANKHWGIAQAMWTKEMKRKYGYIPTV